MQALTSAMQIGNPGTTAPGSDETVYMVLLVDDQVMVAETIRRILASESDLDFHYCRNPADAIATIERIQPTVILQDLVMPGVDGLTLVAQYRVNPKTRDIPVIVLSSKEDARTKRDAFTAGANDYLVKIPDSVELIARVRLHSKAYLNQVQRDAAYRALRESQRQLATKNAALETLNQELEIATRVKSEFLASMSHEIRTPMHGVIGMTALLRDTPLNAEQLAYVEMIGRSGESLLAIINDILDFSKIESGRVELESSAFDLRQCVEDATMLLAGAAAIKGIDLVLLIGPEVPPVVVGDVTRLRQVFINLIGNAVKFTPRGEVVVSVELEASADPDQVRLHAVVTDTGIGMSLPTLARLFQRFEQGDRSTTREFGGTGLGLVISQGLAAIMAGDIQVESEVGRGSSFHLRVTLGKGPDEFPAWTHAPAALRGKRVLIIDDNSAERQVVAQFARTWGLTYTGAESRTGAALMVTGGDGPYDLIFVDQHLLAAMPTGERVTRWPGAAVLVVGTTRIDREEMTRLGASGCVPRPVRPAPLLEAIVAVLAPDMPRAPAGPLVSPRDIPLAERLPLRILLADDNVVNQKVGVGLLKRLGYRPDVVANGAEVMSALDSQRYDVIFLDVQMPEMDGYEAARRVRARWTDQESARPRIVAMTSSALPRDRELCLEAGMDDYISKPFTAQTVSAALERWGRR
jgi:signal transduction histidine kinase